MLTNKKLEVELSGQQMRKIILDYLVKESNGEYSEIDSITVVYNQKDRVFVTSQQVLLSELDFAVKLK